jgi:putative membrane protein
MTFWLKLLHIAAMAVWFTGLSFLPRLITDQLRRPAPGLWPSPLGRTLYFGVMTPAAVTTIVLGMVLLADGFSGAWLPAKLVLVAAAVLLHVLAGKLLFDPPPATAGPLLLLRTLNWLPLLLLLGIAALAAGQPQRLPPLGGT